MKFDVAYEEHARWEIWGVVGAIARTTWELSGFSNFGDRHLELVVSEFLEKNWTFARVERLSDWQVSKDSAPLRTCGDWNLECREIRTFKNFQKPKSRS